MSSQTPATRTTAVAAAAPRPLLDVRRIYLEPAAAALPVTSSMMAMVPTVLAVMLIADIWHEGSGNAKRAPPSPIRGTARPRPVRVGGAPRPAPPGGHRAGSGAPEGADLNQA